MTINGKNLIITAGGQVLFGATSCKITVDVATNEVSSHDDGEWEHIRAGKKSWKIDTRHIVLKEGWNSVFAHPLDAVSMVGGEYLVRVSINMDGLGSVTLTGNAICRAWEIEGDMNTLTKGSFSFKGNGPLQ